MTVSDARVPASNPSPETMRNSPLFLAAIIGILLAAFALFSYDLSGQSLWRDEALSILRARQSLALQWQNINIIDGTASPDLHPPLYFLALSLWRQALGESEFAYRLFSAFVQVLALAVMASLAWRLLGRRAALAVMLLAAVSPFLWYYAGETRMYALVNLEAVLLLTGFYALVVRRPARTADYLAFIGLAVVLVLTHYTGIFLVASLTLALFLMRRRFGKVEIGAAMLVLLLAAGSLLTVDPVLFSVGLAALDPLALWQIISEGARTFTLGSTMVPVTDTWRLAPFVLLAIVGAVGAWQRLRRHRSPDILLTAGGFILTAVFIALGSIVSAKYGNPRHLTILAPFWFLAQGYGFAYLWRRTRSGALLLLVAGAVIGLLALREAMVEPPQKRDDVRALTAYLTPRLQPADTIIWHDAAMMAAYEYYALPDVTSRAIPAIYQSDDVTIRRDFRDWSAPYERIWFVNSFGLDTGVTDILADEWVVNQTADFPASWAGLHLRLYTRPLETDELPAGATPLSVGVDGLEIAGISGPETAEAGGGDWWDLYWTEASPSAAGGPPNVCLGVVDETGAIWSETCHQVGGRLAPATGGLQRRQFWLPLPEGLPPVKYPVRLWAPGTTQDVGSLTVIPAEPATEFDPIHTFTDTSLLAVEWKSDNFRTGTWVLGDLIWRAEGPAQGTATVEGRLVDWLGRPVSTEIYPLGPANYPRSDWQVGVPVRQSLALPLPFELDGRYRAQLRVDQEAWQTIGLVKVVDWPLETTLPAGVTPLADEVRFGQEITLAAYDVTQVGEEKHITLYWRSETPIPDEYVVFIHLGPSGQAPIAETSSIPANWSRPVTSWRAGEIIEDIHILEIPAEVAPDSVLFVGMYRPEDPSQRLPVTVNGLDLPDGRFPLEQLAPPK